MKSRYLILALALVGSAHAGETVKLPADERPDAVVQPLQDLVKPQPGESKWATIPWLTDLDEARRRAAKEDKPLFVWRAGGGEVLGRA